jgi:GNAT superfamily N-acetyltransferase
MKAAITTDYVPGSLGRIIALHAEYYAAHWGFGALFETEVAADLAAFARDLPRPDSRLWLALLDGGLIGSVAIDGRHAANDGAHLRWFCLAPAAQGQGVGRALLRDALAFCRACGFARVYLHTFTGLDAARHLYEAHGFRLAHEASDDTWGTRVTEQRFELTL